MLVAGLPSESTPRCSTGLLDRSAVLRLEWPPITVAAELAPERGVGFIPYPVSDATEPTPPPTGTPEATEAEAILAKGDEPAEEATAPPPAVVGW